MEVPRALLDQFTAFTNCDAAIGEELLRSNSLDVEAAVANYFAILEAGGDFSMIVRGNTSASVSENATVNGNASGNANVNGNARSIRSGGESGDRVERHERGGRDGVNFDEEVEEVEAVEDGGDVDEVRLPGRGRLYRGLTRRPPAGLHEDMYFDRDMIRSSPSGFMNTGAGTDISSMLDELRRSTLRRSGMRDGLGRPYVNDVRTFGAGAGAQAHEEDDDDGDGSGGGRAFDRMFRRPTEIIYHGSWDEALEGGARVKKWILVNIQDEKDFACLCLNRDVWNDESVQQLIQARFLFLQYDVGHSKAIAYRQFYPFVKVPHIALIDPRTGERLIVWDGENRKITKNALVEELVEFIEQHNLDDDGSGAIRRSLAARTVDRVSRARELQETEDAQIAAVIAASLETANGGHSEEAWPVSAIQRARRARDAGLAEAIAPGLETANGAHVGEVIPASATEHVRGADNLAGAPDLRETEDAPIEEDVAASLEASSGAHPGEAERASATEHAGRARDLTSVVDPALKEHRSIRAQQDSEYHESLAIDRAKAESERLEKLRQQNEARLQTQKRVAEEALKNAKRARIPSTPPKGCSDPVTELVVRLPNGNRLQRRFYASDTIGNLYDFVETEFDGVKEGSYTLVTPFPRKSYTDRSVTLKEADLFPKAALMIHEL